MRHNSGMETPLCAECGEPIIGRRSNALFCHPAHGKAFWRLQQFRGRALAPLLVAAATARGRYPDATDKPLAAYARRKADRLISQHAAEDRKAARSSVAVVREMMARKGKEPGERRKTVRVND